jgi:hypothetical protein
MASILQQLTYTFGAIAITALSSRRNLRAKVFIHFESALRPELDNEFIPVRCGVSVFWAAVFWRAADALADFVIDFKRKR